jgi:hypothetical protein
MPKSDTVVCLLFQSHTHTHIYIYIYLYVIKKHLNVNVTRRFVYRLWYMSHFCLKAAVLNSVAFSP